MRPPALSPAQMDEAALLYDEHGWSAADIGEHFGVSENAARTALRVRGIEMRPKGNATPPLRVKQCARCLHFLPLSLFSGRDASRETLASWCMSCTAQPADPQPIFNPQPLAQVCQQWSRN